MIYDPQFLLMMNTHFRYPYTKPEHNDLTIDQKSVIDLEIPHDRKVGDDIANIHNQKRPQNRKIKSKSNKQNTKDGPKQDWLDAADAFGDGNKRGRP